MYDIKFVALATVVKIKPIPLATWKFFWHLGMTWLTHSASPVYMV